MAKMKDFMKGYFYNLIYYLVIFVIILSLSFGAIGIFASINKDNDKLPTLKNKKLHLYTNFVDLEDMSQLKGDFEIGFLSENSYKTEQQAIQGFVNTEINGVMFSSTITKTTKVGKIRKQNLMSFPIEVENAIYTSLKLTAYGENFTKKLAVLETENGFYYYSIIPKKGEVLTSSYYNHLFRGESYLNSKIVYSLNVTNENSGFTYVDAFDMPIHSKDGVIYDEGQQIYYQYDKNGELTKLDRFTLGQFVSEDTSYWTDAGINTQPKLLKHIVKAYGWGKTIFVDYVVDHTFYTLGNGKLVFNTNYANLSKKYKPKTMEELIEEEKLSHNQDVENYFYITYDYTYDINVEVELVGDVATKFTLTIEREYDSYSVVYNKNTNKVTTTLSDSGKERVLTTTSISNIGTTDFDVPPEIAI